MDSFSYSLAYMLASNLSCYIQGYDLIVSKKMLHNIGSLG